MTGVRTAHDSIYTLFKCTLGTVLLNNRGQFHFSDHRKNYIRHATVGLKHCRSRNIDQQALFSVNLFNVPRDTGNDFAL